MSAVNVVGVCVVLAVLAVASVFGLALRSRSGRVRTRSAGPAGDGPGWRLAGLHPAPHEHVLLLQLSSPICTPCRRTAARLGSLAGGEARIRHVEIDIADRPEVARVLDVMRTPTVVAFDRGGAELLRISGEPRQGELEEALAAHLG